MFYRIIQRDQILQGGRALMMNLARTQYHLKGKVIQKKCLYERAFIPQQ